MRSPMLTLGVVLLWAVLVAASDPPRYAVASSGPEADAEISPQAARAPFILIFDHEGRLTEVIEERDLPGRSAGPQTALLLREREVTHFIAKEFGPNLVRALDQAAIRHVQRQGPAQEAVLALIEEMGGGGDGHGAARRSATR